jgi:hypothetical protein
MKSDKSKFYDQIDSLTGKREINSTMRSLSTPPAIRYKAKRSSPNYSGPFGYFFKADLAGLCGFKNISLVCKFLSDRPS